MPPIITPQQRKDFAEAEEKPEELKASSIVDDAGNTRENAEKLQDEKAVHEEHIYLTGVRLVAVLASVTLVFFLVLMDMSIITTVRKVWIEIRCQLY